MLYLEKNLFCRRAMHRRHKKFFKKISGQILNFKCFYLKENWPRRRVSVKNGNRNDRIWDGNGRNWKLPPNFWHEISKILNLCGKLRSHFRFRSFPLRIRSFRFPFFTETPRRNAHRAENLCKQTIL